MKKILVSAAVLFSVFANAQMKEGRIIYERTMQMPVRFFAANPEMQNQVPRSRTDQYELLFGNNQSLFQFLPTAVNEDPGTFSGGGMVMRFGGTNDVIYHNFQQATRLDQREIMEKEFLISDTIQKLKWKLTDETKTVLNYTVKKATGQRINTATRTTMENGEIKREEIQDTALVVAWFSTEIPVSVGPDFQGQLPGAILELEVDKGRVVYKAIEISPKVSVAKIKEPKKGKKVTAAEFRTERDKLMEEMRKNMPAGNNIRIQQ